MPPTDFARRSSMRRWTGRVLVALATTAGSVLVVGAPVASFGAVTAHSATTCAGTIASPGSLPGGAYTDLVVTGVCDVDAGQVLVTDNVSVDAGAALLAGFALNHSGPGTSGITVEGSIVVDNGGTLILGCKATSFPCFDDPHQNAATLNSPATVDGDVIGLAALGVVVHGSTVRGDILQQGGGGGPSCGVSGLFGSFPFPSPVYSNYEDNTVGGNLRVTGVNSCWFGALRDQIGGSATFASNTFSDPDASENLDNQVSGNLLCTANSPAVHYGDSGSQPNVVAGFATGQCAFGVMAPNPPGPPQPIAVPSSTPSGYWLGAADGGVFSFGVPFLGGLAGGGPLDSPITGIAAVPGGSGYNLADGSGTVFSIGQNSLQCSSMSPHPLVPNKPVVGIAAAPGGNGCWTVGGDGGVFSWGPNAPFFGSAGALPLVQPIVGIAATPNNDGYDLAAADGGIFAYGPGGAFYGSMGGRPLNQPVVGIAVDPATGGYWLVARDGGVFSFNAPFFGSMGGTPLNKSIVGIQAAPGGNGYYLVAADGGIFAFGPGATFQGSTGSLRLAQPVVGMSLG